MTAVIEKPGAAAASGRVSRQDRAGYGLVAPNLLGMVAFTLVPLLSAVLVSFTDWNVVSGVSGIRILGLTNYAEAFTDAKFWHSVGLTLLYCGIVVPVTTVIGLALAVALDRDVPGRTALRVIFFLPYTVNMVAIGLTWLLVLDPTSGVLAELLKLGGAHSPLWFASSDWALWGLMLIAVWAGVGFGVVIYLGALQNVPTELRDAAAVDGAGAWRRFTAVTWPALLPTTVFLLIIQFIGASQTFGLMVLITQGGPGSSTTTLSYYIYQNGFQFYRFGYASALGMITFAGVLILTSVLMRLQRGRDMYG